MNIIINNIIIIIIIIIILLIIIIIIIIIILQLYFFLLFLIIIIKYMCIYIYIYIYIYTYMYNSMGSGRVAGDLLPWGLREDAGVPFPASPFRVFEVCGRPISPQARRVFFNRFAHALVAGKEPCCHICYAIL